MTALYGAILALCFHFVKPPIAPTAPIMTAGIKNAPARLLDGQ